MSSLINACIGEYRITELLGAGGMGEVYKAVHLHLNRVIAIKILLSDLTDSPTLRRFYNEAKIQASLRHPGVAEYLGFYEFQGRPCILMDYVDGETLLSMITSRGTLPVDEAMRIGRDVTAVAAHFHSLGVVHRDIKSNNIKITTTGQVKLLDFGIARSQAVTTSTREGFVVGTPTILAPEQIRGQRVTPATDIWQLGVLFYEMLAGHLPFEATSAFELYAQIQNAEPTPIQKLNPAVRPSLARIIARCLQKDSAKRFASAQKLMEALDSESVTVTPVSVKQSPKPGFKWPPMRFMVAGMAILGAVLIAILLLHSWDNRAPAAGPVGPSTNQAQEAPTTASANLKHVTVDTMDGVAEVYRGGKKVGNTPLQFEAHMGDSVAVTLRRKGYKELPVQFEVTERKEYSFTLEQIK